jgi:hypothetical protein
MNTTTTNDRPRKTLASQLDRLDNVLDGLSEGLNEAVATAVQKAVGTAVKEAVQAVLTELLTNPAVQQYLQPAAPAAPAPEEKPRGGPTRFGKLCGWVGDRLRHACRVGSTGVQCVGQAVTRACQQTGRRARTGLLAAGGLVVAGAAYLARTPLVAAARWLYSWATSLVMRAGFAFWQLLPAFGVCSI